MKKKKTSPTRAKSRKVLVPLPTISSLEERLDFLTARVSKVMPRPSRYGIPELEKRVASTEEEIAILQEGLDRFNDRWGDFNRGHIASLEAKTAAAKTHAESVEKRADAYWERLDSRLKVVESAPDSSGGSDCADKAIAPQQVCHRYTGLKGYGRKRRGPSPVCEWLVMTNADTLEMWSVNDTCIL